MAAVVQVATGTTNNGTSCTVTFGATATSGNVLVIVMNANRAESNIAVPSGFTEQVRFTSSNTIVVATKTADGTEFDATFTATLGNSRLVGTVYELSGVSSATPNQTDTSGAASTTSLTVGPLTGSGVFIAGVAVGPAAPSPTTFGSWSDSFVTDSTLDLGLGSNNVAQSCGSRVVASSTSVSTTQTWSGGTADGAAVLLEFPASGGGSTSHQPDDATHAHSAESPTLTQTHDLSADPATHAHTAESPTLSQVHVLAPDDATHAHSAESPTVSSSSAFPVDDATHAHSAESPTLTQLHQLAPDEAAHAHTAESPTLTQTHDLSADPATHAHTAESPTLSQVHVLAPDDATHAHTAESPAFGQPVDITVTVAAARVETAAVLASRTGTVEVGDSRSGVAIGSSRQGVTIGPSRIEREA